MIRTQIKRLDYLQNGEWDLPNNDESLPSKLRREIDYFGQKPKQWEFQKRLNDGFHHVGTMECQLLNKL